MSEFRPHDLAIFGSLSDGAIVAIPVVRRLLRQPEAVGVIRRGTRLATQQRSTERAREAIRDIHVRVKFHASLRNEMIGTKDVVATE